jgi:hypothetical protein
VAGGQGAVRPFRLGDVPREAPGGGKGRELAVGHIKVAGLEKRIVDDRDPLHVATRAVRDEPVGHPVEAVVDDRDFAAEIGCERVEEKGVPAVQEEVADDMDVVGGADGLERKERSGASSKPGGSGTVCVGHS